MLLDPESGFAFVYFLHSIFGYMRLLFFQAGLRANPGVAWASLLVMDAVTLKCQGFSHSLGTWGDVRHDASFCQPTVLQQTAAPTKAAATVAAAASTATTATTTTNKIEHAIKVHGAEPQNCWADPQYLGIANKIGACEIDRPHDFSLLRGPHLVPIPLLECGRLKSAEALATKSCIQSVAAVHAASMEA